MKNKPITYTASFPFLIPVILPTQISNKSLQKDTSSKDAESQYDQLQTQGNVSLDASLSREKANRFYASQETYYGTKERPLKTFLSIEGRNKTTFKF